MFKFLLEKEFKQMVKNSLKIIIIMPTLILLLIPWAVRDYKYMNVSIVDNDHSILSGRFIQKVTSSGYFRLTDILPSHNAALRSVEAGMADAIIEIQPEFEQDLMKTGIARVMISVNSVNGTKGALGSQYLTGIVRDYAQDLLAENGSAVRAVAMPASVLPSTRFNPYTNYKMFIVPALMVILLTFLTGFLPAMNIVGEKQSGTLEQLNKTPVRKFPVIIAKIIPYWIAGYIIFSIVLALAALVYGLTPTGSLATIFLYATVYVLAISGMGLVISNYSGTMQDAQLITAFIILTMILMCGAFFPINSMPHWLQVVASFNPLYHFMEVMKAVYLKGSAFTDLSAQFYVLCGFALFFVGWAVLSYKIITNKTLKINQL